MARVPHFLLLAGAAFALSGCGSLALFEKPPGPDLAEVVTLVNEARRAGGACGSMVFPSGGEPLHLSGILSSAAQKHSEDMDATGQLTHVTPEGALHYAPGTSFRQRARLEGYSGSPVGENAAMGYPSARSVVNGWLGSEGHCRNLMNPNADEIGVGHAGAFWTQVFGRGD